GHAVASPQGTVPIVTAVGAVRTRTDSSKRGRLGGCPNRKAAKGRLVSASGFRAGEGTRRLGRRGWTEGIPSSFFQQGTESGRRRAAPLAPRLDRRNPFCRSLPENSRAGEGIRTLDVNLGKVALYH